LRLFSFGGYGLALAALALVVFGAYDSYTEKLTPSDLAIGGGVPRMLRASARGRAVGRQGVIAGAVARRSERTPRQSEDIGHRRRRNLLRLRSRFARPAHAAH